MIISIECKICYGNGKLHKNGNGNPDDEGENCLQCNGTGVVDYDLENDAEE